MLPQEGLLTTATGRGEMPRRARPGLSARLLSRVRWFSLDERLVAGHDPAASELLAAHAARLTTQRRREDVAEALHGLLRVVEQGRRASRISPDRSALLANEALVRGLAQRLESRTPVYARGVARLELLLSDSTGPAFRGGVSELGEELARASAELEGAAAPDGTEAQTTGRRPLRRRLPWRGHAHHSRRVAASAAAPRGFAGSSFRLPDGSWYHGRRDAA